MTTSTETQNLSDFTGKKVIFTRNLPEPDKDGNSAVEVEGTVQVGNEHGLLVKPKGRVQLDLVPFDQIESGSVRLADSASLKLKRSSVLPVKLGQARRHLLERHGVTLSWINEVTEQQAYEYHASIDHVGDDLGHDHDKKPSDKGKDDDSSGAV